MEAGSAAATLVRGEPADRKRGLTVNIEYMRSEPGTRAWWPSWTRSPRAERPGRHDPGDDAGRPALSGRLGADHGAAMAGYASISSLLVIPAAVLMGIAAFLL
jgi:hypothetical protein